MSSQDKLVKLDTISIAVKDLIDDYIYRIDLDADYQREKIWSTKQQQLLLDSILQDIDIPKLYLAKTHGNKQFDFECIDGKQRMLTLLAFFKPEYEKDSTSALKLLLSNRNYTYPQLKSELPKLAQRLEEYKLDFVCYDLASLDEDRADELIREIFRRLQLGVKLNSGERLKALQGTIRDFVFNEMRNEAPFLRNTSLSPKRFSREFTLAQICLNSFKHKEIGEYGRARLLDLEDFFNENANLDSEDPNLRRIRKVLAAMDDAFGARASTISSRAVAVSAYLFAENLYLDHRANVLSDFATFFVNLLDEIERNMDLIKRYKSAENTELMDQFQKHILQASVEPAAIRRRNDFLRKAFAYFTDSQTKGRIIGVKKER